VTPRGFIDAASTALPASVRLLGDDRGVLGLRQSSAVKISFLGVRTPRIVTTPSTIGNTVLALSVNS
jgi:hypothetical protein